MLVLATVVLGLRTPQVVRLRDAATNQQISLVGTVHYNSASIARATEEVAAVDGLGAVVVEACQSRWDSSLKLAPPGSTAARLIKSEMQAAAGVAMRNGVPVMLGDADVSRFLPRAKDFARSTVRQLSDPFGDGWRSIYADLKRTLRSTFDTADIACSELLLKGEAPLSAADFAKPSIIIGFLGSLVRYPVAFALKAPFPFAVLSSALFALGTAADTADLAAAAALESGDFLSPALALTALLAALEAGLVVLTSRLLLVVFLEERNAELARSIRRAAAESDAPVVAILGGLHVNGVARLLLSTETPDADGLDCDGVWWEIPEDMSAASAEAWVN